MSAAIATEKILARVLIVEDEAVVALDLSQRLTTLGYGVAGIADSGESAVMSAARERPDVILMDIRLQGEMDGIDAAHRIREANDVPVIYVTSYTDDTTVQRAVKTEPLGYLIKPFTDQELRTTIEVALYRHSMEAKIREHRAWLDSVLHSIADAVIATDERGSVRLLNPVAAQLTGWDEAEALGRPFGEIVMLAGANSHEPVDPLATVLHSHSAVNMDRFILQRRDGAEITIENSTATVARDNVIAGGIFVFRDVTKRLRAEMELQQEQRMDALSRLASGVALEFNNLLTVILCSASDATKKWGDTPALREEFGRIARAARSAASLTQTLLNLGRGQLLNSRLFDVNEILLDVSHMMNGVLGPRVKFQMETLAQRACVRADPEQLQRAIIDILLHVRDALHNSGEVLVRTGNGKLPERPDGAPGADAVTITITDNGVGLAPELKSRIFEPFVTATSTAGKRQEGLGLASAYGIVAQIGGSIGVESEVGKGSTFTVLLPLYQKTEPVLAPDSASTAVRPEAHVLVVEEDPQVRDIEERILTTEGIQVRQASNGLHALAKFQSAPGEIDLVVTGILMSGMNGIELARQVLEIRPDLHILFISGHAEDSMKLAQFPPGAAAFLLKPFGSAELREAVSKLLAGPAVQRNAVH